MIPELSEQDIDELLIIKTSLNTFKTKMWDKLIANFDEKEMTWRTCRNKFLIGKLIEHTKSGNWVDVANYAFMLYDKKEGDSEK